MHDAGKAEKGAIRPEFNRLVMIDFQIAKVTFDAGVLILREVNERFGIIDPMEDSIADTRSSRWHLTIERCLGMVSPVLLCIGKNRYLHRE